jgi:hypothetical protein
MQVNKIIAIGLIITNIMFLFSSAVEAQPRKNSVECNAVLQRSKKQIQKNRKVKVVGTVTFDISQEYKNYPNNRPLSYRFFLAGSATHSILNSDQFLTMISQQIINKCPSISIVGFNESQTDYVISYGLLKNNIIGLFKCIDWEVAPKKLDWGYVGCI